MGRSRGRFQRLGLLDRTVPGPPERLGLTRDLRDEWVRKVS